MARDLVHEELQRVGRLVGEVVDRDRHGTLGLAALGAVDDRAPLLEQLAEVVDLVLGDVGSARGGIDLRAGDLLAEVGAFDQGNDVWVLGVHQGFPCQFRG